MSAPPLAPVGVELLDNPAADAAAVARSLHHIARANRWFGGRAALRFGLQALLNQVARGSTLTLLDVGTGSGDLPRHAVRWAAARGIRLVPAGLERCPAAARLARDGGLPTALGCGATLPVRDHGVDLVLVSQVAHHLAAPAVVRLLRDCDRVARVGVIVSDLVRSPLAAAGFWLGSRLLRFDPATRADGITSIRRGFTRQEFQGFLREAGIAGEVYRRPRFRLVAVWRPGRRS
ncbi:MAG: methyltransferase domain-containing protein [Gemmatimonadales bacterium]